MEYRIAVRLSLGSGMSIVGLFLVLLFVQPTHGQRRNLVSYSLEDGLPQAQVQDILQDERGYLWLVTHAGGVARFDGHSFTPFTVEDGLPDNSVVTVHEDRSGTLWFGTEGGLARYDGAEVQVFTTEDGLPHSRVHAIAGGHDGPLWFGTPDGVVTYDGSSLEPVAPNRIDNTSENSLAARGDTLWVGTEDHVYRRTDTTLTPIGSEWGLNAGASLLAVEADRGLLVETTKGLYRQSGRRFERISGTQGLDIRSLLSVSPETIWIGTLEGLYRYQGGKTRLFTPKLKGIRVDALHQDREQNLWIGTDGEGLYKRTPTPFKHFTTADGLAGNDVWDVEQGPDGGLWIATENGLNRYDGTSFSRVQGPDGLTQKAVYALKRTRNGGLWASTQGRLYHYDGSTFNAYETVDGERVGLVYRIVQDASGAVWFGTLGRGLIRYDGTRLTQFTTEDGLSSNRISDLALTPQGRLWVGTDDGITRWDGTAFTSLPVGGAERGGLNTLVVDADGYVWMGTERGLYVHPPLADTAQAESARADSVVSFTREDGLNDNTPYLMHLDRDGRLWMGTNKGLNRLDIQTYKQTGRMPIRTYGKEDGFLGVEAASHAVYEADDGILWFGTVNGVTRYDPAEEQASTLAPRPRVTDVGLFSKALDWRKYSEGVTPWERLPINLTLPYNENHLIFRYVGLSYTSPEEVRHRYRLKGFSEQWSKPTKDRRATYSNLPPGAYTFQVKASKGKGKWSSRTATYSFTIQRPFWQAAWFYVLCGLGGVGLLVGIVWGTVRWRTRRLQREKEMLERQLSQHSEEVKERWS